MIDLFLESTSNFLSASGYYNIAYHSGANPEPIVGDYIIYNNKNSFPHSYVFGSPLIPCCTDPVTGYFRDGFCRTISQDTGTHTVCAVVTQNFLDYSFSRGNDLMTAVPQWQFPGLKPGDKWCLCISRWLEAEKVGKAPNIILEATHEKTLQYTSLALLQSYAVNL